MNLRTWLSLWIVSSVLSLHAQTTGINPGTTTPVSGMLYYGGPIIAEPTVYIIWYGNWNKTNGTDNSDGQSIIRDFLHAIGGSPYFAINTTFSTKQTTITGNVNFGGETSDTGSFGRLLTDARVRLLVTNAITSGALPNDPQGVYFVLSASDVVELSGFGYLYCGWHSHTKLVGGKVRYAFIGNPARYMFNCGSQRIGPNGNAGVDSMVSIIAHELSEMTTDPDHNAWIDLRGAENADKCAWTFGHHQYRAANGAWANVGWDFLDGYGNVMYHRDYLIQRNTVRLRARTMIVNYCATSFDPTSGKFQQ